MFGLSSGWLWIDCSKLFISSYILLFLLLELLEAFYRIDEFSLFLSYFLSEGERERLSCMLFSP